MVNDLGRIRESNLKLRSSQIENPLDSNNSTTQFIGQDNTYAACPSYIINIISILLYTHRNSLVTSLEHAFTAGYPLIFFGLGLVGFYGFPLVSLVFIWFCLVFKGETKEKKTQGKDKPIKKKIRMR